MLLSVSNLEEQQRVISPLLIESIRVQEGEHGC
jgi:hypothetical protein